ncbi:thioesterase family protein [Allobranchiibius sp. GilTou38]|uniref:acyl-CoA thioesterase n=1 Tax=Allobranchiibius sp. GilTou38 TaxID=2815210 RepID=UPI001AA15E20|nr:thioesterase family protein [Allobranchiibius sp. GilTou38]MBO1768053.1 acyl-CoA thioesterase [Allobranchiibius sp. GilTou38]
MPNPLFHVSVPLRWSDMDALRHVNNVQFLRLLEEARILAFNEWFDGSDEAHERPRLLIARAEIDYLRQLHYRHEPICITTWVTRIAGASFDLGYEVRETPDSTEVFASAETTQVAFDMDTQRPTRLSESARTILQQYAGPPVALKRRPVDHT